MHTLIAYAAPPGPQCRAAIARLALPNLKRLLAALQAGAQLQGSADDLTPIAERAHAKALGLAGADGLIPWAALEAQERGLTGLHGSAGWAWITPCHWTIQADHVDMSEPRQLALTPHDADVLRQAMFDYFHEDGITLFAPGSGQPHTRWLAHGAVFNDLATASLDRVTGQSVDRWMPRQPQAKTLRKLQNEMQMLLYTHPVNDARAQHKLPPINAFWVSGTGTLQGAPVPTPLHLRDALRAPALADDANAWASAWAALDASTLAHELQRLQQGQALTLTLCGEALAQSFEARPLSAWQRLQRRVSPPNTSELLTSLCTS